MEDDYEVSWNGLGKFFAVTVGPIGGIMLAIVGICWIYETQVHPAEIANRAAEKALTECVATKKASAN